MDSTSKLNLFPTNSLQKANIKVSKIKISSLKTVNCTEETLNKELPPNEKGKSSEYSDDCIHSYENCYFENNYENLNSKEIIDEQVDDSSHFYENVTFEETELRKLNMKQSENKILSLSCNQSEENLSPYFGEESTAISHSKHPLGKEPRKNSRSPCRSGILFGYNSPEFIIENIEKSSDTSCNNNKEQIFKTNNETVISDSKKPFVDADKCVSDHPQVVLRENRDSNKRKSRKSTIISSLQELAEKQNNALLVKSVVTRHGSVNEYVGRNHVNTNGVVPWGTPHLTPETLKGENKEENTSSGVRFTKEVSAAQQISNSIIEEDNVGEVSIDADILESFYQTAAVFEKQDAKQNHLEFGNNNGLLDSASGNSNMKRKQSETVDLNIINDLGFNDFRQNQTNKSLNLISEEHEQIIRDNEIEQNDKYRFFSRPTSLYIPDSGSRPLSLDEEGMQEVLSLLLSENSADIAAGIMSVERRGTKALELWAQRATAGYDHVSISNMTTSWRNGMAFCALVHRYRPDLLEFSSLKPENVLENNALAFRLAEQHLGIPALLDAEDMAQSQVPDRLSVLTYVSQYYQVMHQTFTTSGITAPKRKVPSPDISLGQSPTKIKAGLDTTPKTSIVRKSEKVLTGGRGMVCVACTNPVFLAERLMVGSPGQLMHRTCFRCARCSNQLNLASYYETEKGQYCCETCPDEERFISAGEPSSEAAMTTGSKTSLTNTDNVDTDDSDSDESSDLESRAECPAATSIQDVQHDTIPVISSHNNKPNTPEPIKPRSVFLSKEMLGNTSENDDRISRDSSCENIYSNNLSAVSSSDFEAKSDVSLPDSTGTNDSYKYRLNDCDNAKGYVTDPPESNSKDLNAEQGQSQVNKEKASSIVSERLKMFMDKEAKSKSQSSARYSSNHKYFTKIYKDDNVNESIDVRHVVNSSILRNNEKAGMLPFESSRENICEISDTKYNKKSIEDITDTCTKKDIDIDKDIDEDKDKDIDEKNIDCEASTFKSFDIPLDNEKNNESFEGENTVLVKENSNEFGIEGELLEKNKEICQDDEKEFNPFDEDYEENQEDKSKIDDNIETKINDDIETKIEANIKTKINDNIETKINDNIETEINDNIETEINDTIETKSDNNIESKINDNLEKSDLIIKEQEPANFDTDEINIKEQEPEKEYPDDLNPFGDDDSDDIVPPALPTTQPPQTRTNNETYNTSPTIIETTHDDNAPPKPKRIVISANFNPFEEDEDEEDIEPSKKVISAPTKPAMNPFWSDDEEPLEETEGGTETSPRPKGAKPPRPPPPTLGRYSSPSAISSFSSASNTPTKGSPGGNTTPRKRISAPTPPSVNSRELFPQDSSTNDIVGACPPSPTPSTVSRLKKKGRRAPAPPPGPSPISSRISIAEGNTGDTTSLNSLGATSMSGSVTSQGKDEEQDEVMSWKQQKEMKNHSNKLIGSSGNDNNAAVSNIQKSPLNKGPKSELIRRPSLSKSEAGEWQRKKGPAPPRPVPQKRAIKKLPMRTIQTELYDIEIKQTELERQGVLLETTIRGRTESPENPEDSMSSSGPSSIEVEDMILQLFELVNEKNELFRRQTEFMYLKREKRLEEEYAELEYQIRCLMMKPPNEKNETDAAQEEELIGRLVKIVEQRDEITNCLELDRLREAQEDESIANHMMQYQEKHIDGVEQNGVEVVIPKKKKVLKLPKKKKKNKEEKIEKKGKDKDKDVDDIEAKENKKKKKKWFI